MRWLLIPLAAMISAQALAQTAEAPFLVHRGEAVVLIIRGSGYAIRAPARALVNGRAGDQVRLVLTASHRQIEARVTGPGTTEIRE